MVLTCLLTSIAIALGALTAGAQPPALPAWTTIATNNAEVEELVRQLEGDETDQAVQALQKLADRGNGDALFALARAHAMGRGVTASEKAAQRLLQQGVEHRHAESFLAKAVQAESAGQDDALFYYGQAAEFGHPLAQLRLGRSHENGEFGLGKNPAMAVRFYRRAHESGLSRGTYELGRCHRDGVGVSPDAITSTKLIREAAEAGLPVAQLAMAEAYEDGRGIERDNVAAVGWLLLAAQRGDRDAFVQLGTRYEKGEGVMQDLNQAGQYFSAAAKQGDQVAQYRLAMLYIEGRGAKPDPIRGYVLLDGVRGLPPADKVLEELKASLTAEQLQRAQERIKQLQLKKSGR